MALYPTLEKYEWDVSYTLAGRRLRRQRGQPSRINPISRREHSTGEPQAQTKIHQLIIRYTSHVKEEKATSE